MSLIESTLARVITQAPLPAGWRAERMTALDVAGVAALGGRGTAARRSPLLTAAAARLCVRRLCRLAASPAVLRAAAVRLV